MEATIIWVGQEVDGSSIIGWTLDAARIGLVYKSDTYSRYGQDFVVLTSDLIDIEEETALSMQDYYSGGSDNDTVEQDGIIIKLMLR